MSHGGHHCGNWEIKLIIRAALPPHHKTIKPVSSSTGAVETYPVAARDGIVKNEREERKIPGRSPLIIPAIYILP